MMLLQRSCHQQRSYRDLLKSSSPTSPATTISNNNDDGTTALVVAKSSTPRPQLLRTFSSRSCRRFSLTKLMTSVVTSSPTATHSSANAHEEETNTTDNDNKNKNKNNRNSISRSTSPKHRQQQQQPDVQNNTTKRRGSLSRLCRSSSLSRIISTHTCNKSSSHEYIPKQKGGGKKIQTYIRYQQWYKLRNYLRTEEGCYDLSQHAATYYLNSKTNEGDNQKSSQEELTLLHLACQYHPPLDIIQHFLRVCPLWLHDRSNPLGHTPLHIACAWGAHPSVVELLLQHEPSYASLKDKEGRTPLHLHCALCCHPNTCDPFSFAGTEIKRPAKTVEQEQEDDEERKTTMNENDDETLNKAKKKKKETVAIVFDISSPIASQYHEVERDEFVVQLHTYMDHLIYPTQGPIPLVIETLHAASPSSINEEDHHGMNPIEYVLAYTSSNNDAVSTATNPPSNKQKGYHTGRTSEDEANKKTNNEDDSPTSQCMTSRRKLVIKMQKMSVKQWVNEQKETAKMMEEEKQERLRLNRIRKEFATSTTSATAAAAVIGSSTHSTSQRRRSMERRNSFVKPSTPSRPTTLLLLSEQRRSSCSEMMNLSQKLLVAAAAATSTNRFGVDDDDYDDILNQDSNVDNDDILHKDDKKQTDPSDTTTTTTVSSVLVTSPGVSGSSPFDEESTIINAVSDPRARFLANSRMCQSERTLLKKHRRKSNEESTTSPPSSLSNSTSSKRNKLKRGDSLKKLFR